MITHDHIRRFYSASSRLPKAFVNNAGLRLVPSSGTQTIECDWQTAERIASVISKYYAIPAIKQRLQKKTT